MEKAQTRVDVDFIEAFSCAYSVTKNLRQELGGDIDRMLLRSVVGSALASAPWETPAV